MAVTLPGESWFLKLMGWYGDQKMKKVGSFLNFAVVLKEPHPNIRSDWKTILGSIWETINLDLTHLTTYKRLLMS